METYRFVIRTASQYLTVYFAVLAILVNFIFGKETHYMLRFGFTMVQSAAGFFMWWTYGLMKRRLEDLRNRLMSYAQVLSMKEENLSFVLKWFRYMSNAFRLIAIIIVVLWWLIYVPMKAPYEPIQEPTAPDFPF